MKNIKTLITASLTLASVVSASASNLFNTLNDGEPKDTKSGLTVPTNRPSANHFEKNTNAKSMAKRLAKSPSANAILGKTSDVLERYGYHASPSGAFFSNKVIVTASPSTESCAIVSNSRNERGDLVRVKVESNKDLQVNLNTETGVEVPFELMNLGENEVFISPSYTLPDGNYTIKLKSKTEEIKLKLLIEHKEFLGKK